MRNNYRQIGHLILSAPGNSLINFSVPILMSFNLQSVHFEAFFISRTRQLFWYLMILLLIIILSSLFLPRISAAAEWSFEPSISLFSGRETNPTLTTGVHESVTAVAIYPRMKWGIATETSAVNLDLLLGATEYSDNQVPDSNVQILTLNSRVQASERTKWDLDSEYRRNILYESVQIESGTGDLGDTDVGLITQKVRRESLSIRPSWIYALTERSSLGLRYAIRDVSFSNSAGTGLEDYKNHRLTANYSYRLTQKNNLNLLLVHSAHRPDVSNSKSDSNQILAGISHVYTETSQGRFLVGVGETSEKTSAGTNDTSTYVFEAGLKLRSELSTVDGVISRDVHSSGTGRTVVTNQFRTNMTRKISPMVNMKIRAKMFRNKVLEGSDPNDDRRYYELSPGLSWLWNPKLAFGLEYQYRKKKFDTSPESAESNALYLEVTYTWPRQVVSR